jgi:DNA polymerase III delta prime subunit
MIDIFSIKPHEVSRDLRGYTILFYGQPKTGKTTTAARFPQALLCAFETGYLAIPGVMAQPINKWSEFKQILKQLDSDQARQQFKNIVVDTVDIAYDLCEKYICNQNGVSTVGDLAYGKGYALAKKEFDEALRKIPQMGYGLVMISHAQDKTFKDENGEEYQQIVPTLANQPRLVVDRMSDIIGYAHPFQDEDGSVHTTLFMRGTPRFVAGSRFKYTPDSIDFSYDNLVNAIGDAIDKQAQELGGQYVTDAPTNAHTAEPELDFDALMNQFNELVSKIQNATGSSFGTTWAPRIVAITDKYLGKGKKVSEMSRDQVEQLVLIVDDLVEAVGNGL